jgi:hypothetical protein
LKDRVLAFNQVYAEALEGTDQQLAGNMQISKAIQDARRRYLFSVNLFGEKRLHGIFIDNAIIDHGPMIY